MDDFPDKPIEILSHIEPSDSTEFATTVSDSINFELIDKKVKETITSIPEISDYKIINLLKESTGYFLSIIIYLEGEMSIFDAHLISESFEIALKQAAPDLYNCIIHTEPMKNKQS